ncbi:MAG: RHS repeat domain-containing protein, partial [Thermoleophilia bacterium]
PFLPPVLTNIYTGGRVTTQEDALGAETSLVYNQAAKTTTETDARGRVSLVSWDGDYRFRSLTDPLGNLSSATYSSIGPPTSVTDPRGYITSLTYDARRNANATKDPEGHVSRAGYDEKENPLFVHDALGGRLTRTVQGLLFRDDFSTNSLSQYQIANEMNTPVWSFSSGILSQTWGLAWGSLSRTDITDARLVTGRLRPVSSSPQADVLTATGDREATGKAFPGYAARLTPYSVSIQKRAGGAWTSLASTSVSATDYQLLRLYTDGSTIRLRLGVNDLSTVSLSATDSTYTQGSGGVRAKAVSYFDWVELRRSHTLRVTGLPAGARIKIVKGGVSREASESTGTATVDVGDLLFPLDTLQILDPDGRLLEEVGTLEFSDLGGGDVFAYDQGADHRVSFAYDSTRTYLTGVTDPFGTTTFTYFADGRLHTLSDALLHTWSYSYNAQGDPTSVTDPLTLVWQTEYDTLGRPTASVDPNGSRVEVVYDPKGNVTTLKDPLVQTDPTHRHQVDITYDANDNQTSLQDANGNLTQFAYNDMDLLTGVTDALSGGALYGYDPAYNLTSVTDPRSNTTSYTYDDANRLKTVTDPLTRTTELFYDPAGNVTKVHTPTGNETSYTYTADDLLHTVGYLSDPLTYTFSYNPTHTLASVATNTGRTWSYLYDSGNRPTAATDQNNPALSAFTVASAYDAVSNRTSLTVGALAPYTFSYNARNELATLSGPGGQTGFTYDAGGRRTQAANPGGRTRAFTYDPASRVTQVQNQTASGTQTFTYTYDAAGNVLSENQQTYNYDALNRLTGWYDPARALTTSYTYDAAGNLTQVQEGQTVTETYAFNQANQITNTGFTYDQNGNLTADGAYTYLHDQEDRLKEVKQGATSIAQMTYDFLGRRSSLTTGGATTYFHYDGINVVAETNASGAVTASYLYDDAGQLVSMTRGGQTYYYQTNARGDVVTLTNAAGTVVNTYTYDPWGKVLSATEQVVNPYRYAGYRYDAGTGLYYLWNRYYSPGLRRFLTLDVIGGNPSRTQSLNGYAYCEDNPLRYTDPTGLFAWVAVWIAAETGADALTFGSDASAAHEAFAAGNWKLFGKKAAWAAVDIGFVAMSGTPNPRSAIKVWRLVDEAWAALRPTNAAYEATSDMIRADWPKLKLGTSGKDWIRQMAAEDDVYALFQRWTAGGEVIPARGPLTQVRLSDGTLVQLRKSAEHGTTIDVHLVGGDKWKVHIAP